MEGVANDQARLIKRYANRKLYDTRDSRYVTLQHIASFVRDGEDVRIIDNKSKEDVTNVTLAQIIYEEEKAGEGDRRSVRSLRDFIQDGRARILTSIFDGPMGRLVPHKEGEDASPEAPFDAMLGVGHAQGDAAGEPGRDAGDAVKEPFKALVAAPKELFDELSRIADDRLRAILGGAVTHVQQLQAEVRRLQGRIEELEQRLSQMAKRPVKPEDEPTTPGAEDAGDSPSTPHGEG